MMEAQVGCYNRGNVWDKIATEWAGKEDGMASILCYPAL